MSSPRTKTTAEVTREKAMAGWSGSVAGLVYHARRWSIDSDEGRDEGKVEMAGMSEWWAWCGVTGCRSVMVGAPRWRARSWWWWRRRRKEENEPRRGTWRRQRRTIALITCLSLPATPRTPRATSCIEQILTGCVRAHARPRGLTWLVVDRTSREATRSRWLSHLEPSSPPVPVSSTAAQAPQPRSHARRNRLATLFLGRAISDSRP